MSRVLNLHLLNDQWWQASFYIVICHLYICFHKVSVKILFLFYKNEVIFLLSFESSLDVVDTNPCQICGLQIFYSSLQLFLLFFDHCFTQRKNCKFVGVQFSNFFFYGLSSWCHVLGLFAQHQILKLFSMFYSTTFMALFYI